MRSEKSSRKMAIAANLNIKERDFWLDKLSGEWVKACFPYDHIRETPPAGIGTGTVKWRISGETFSRLMTVSNRNDNTLHMILTAGLNVLLYKYTGSTDILMGTPIYKQEEDAETEFINTVLVLRNHLHGGITFRQLLMQVRETIIEATENYAFPVALLPGLLGSAAPGASDENGFPLFAVSILLENIHDKKYLRHIGHQMAISFLRGDEYIEGTVEYSSLFYREASVRRIVGYFSTILHEGLADVNRELRRIEMLSAEERQQVLVRFNHTEGDYPREKTFHELFMEKVEEFPDNIAVVGSVAEGALTYKKLNEKSNQMAWLLKKRGVGPGRLVGLMLDNSLDMMICILGILKAGGAYLPIGPGLPRQRVLFMLNDSNAVLLLTGEKILRKHKFISLQDFEMKDIKKCITPARAQVKDLDSLQMVDRSLVDYSKYHPLIGQSMVKNSITLQFSRGCVFKCLYCFKIWPDRYVMRTAENLFEEVNMYYKMGIRRFGFTDDLPNFNKKEISKFYRLIIKNRLNIHMHFPNGIRGDILTKDFIDLLVEAGAVTMDLALETSSPRLQKLLKKNVNIPRLRENVQYIIDNYPHVILGVQIMHGFPTETEEEAKASLDFIKSFRWLPFGYMHILKIYPNTDMARFAMENGISREAILRSQDLAYHELPETLPFSENFTRQCQTEYLSEFFLLKERLLKVLPYQMKMLTEDELVQKYNSYLPEEIGSFPDLLDKVGICPGELEGEFLPADFGSVTDFNGKLLSHFPENKSEPGALRLLLLDLSQHFSSGSSSVYYVCDPPLGLMYLLTELNKTFKSKIKGKILKSRIDFDSFDRLKSMIFDFKPDIIGIRTLTFFKDFFHRSVSLLRQWGVEVPIIAGGPYATSSYQTMLQDPNIDLAVLGEGEITLGELIAETIKNNGKFPGEEVLKNIPGIAFIESKEKAAIRGSTREILMVDRLTELLEQESEKNPGNPARSVDVAYTIYTSGSTGIPKGVLVRHNQLVNQLAGLIQAFRFDSARFRYIVLAAFTFDVSLMHFGLPLLTGSKFFLISDKIKKDVVKLWRFIAEKEINVLNIVPAFMETILKNIEKKKIKLEYLFVGGEVFSKSLFHGLKETFAVENIINIYGPTEATINACYHLCDEVEPGKTIPIGRPCMNYRIYILDNDLNLVPPGVKGQLYISGEGVALGYLNNPELTFERFVKYKSQNTNKGEGNQKLLRKIAGPGGETTRFLEKSPPGRRGQTKYKTGDLARWLEDGSIDFLGRIDRQVKIRGFRIELGEIENRLRLHPGIEEVVVTSTADASGDRYLCAYFVVRCGGGCECIGTNTSANTKTNTGTTASQLREYLLKQLPDYMVPAYFMQVEKIPLTPSGKIDKHALPQPGLPDTEITYTGPRHELDEQLVELWADVLGREKEQMGIDINFFESGGHSLKGTILVSRLHKKFNVKVPLSQIFVTPTIRGLAEYIRRALPEHHQSLEPVEKREYYSLSSAQQRLYLFQQIDEKSIVYNMPMVMELEGWLDKDRLEKTFRDIIRRHESFRTCFGMVGEDIVQRVHDAIDHNHWLLFINKDAGDDMDTLMGDFIKPFDLSQAPLLRVGLLELKEEHHILIVDMHHIITDGISMGILIDEFMSFYQGQTLPPVKLQYKDYSQRQQSQRQQLKEQEKYWLSQFEGNLPVTGIPTDFPRPQFRSYEGAQLAFRIDNQLTNEVKQLISGTGITLYMLLLAIQNILLCKYTGQEDIVIGSGVAGRRHTDLEHVMGMFVNILALRNYPAGNLTFLEFLEKVKQNCLEAFKNQDYQFEELIRKLNLHGNSSGNPIFDTVCQMADIPMPGIVISGLRLTPYPFRNNITRFDMIINGKESKEGDAIDMVISYSTELFKPSTIEEMARNYREILEQVVANNHIKLKDIAITIDVMEAHTGVFNEIKQDFGF